MNRIFMSAVVSLWIFSGFCGEISIKNGEKIAFLGDSIAYGEKQPSRYMDLVTMSLAHYGIRIQRIDGGVPGFRSDLMLQYLDVKDYSIKMNASRSIQYTSFLVNQFIQMNIRI